MKTSQPPTTKTCFGLIVRDENDLSFSSPRMIDGDEFDSFHKAMARAVDLVTSGENREIEIVQARLYGPDGDGWWGEVPEAGSVVLDASKVNWFIDPNDSEGDTED